MWADTELLLNFRGDRGACHRQAARSRLGVITFYCFAYHFPGLLYPLLPTFLPCPELNALGPIPLRLRALKRSIEG